MSNAQILAENIKNIAKAKNITLKSMLSDCDLNVNTLNQISDKKGISCFGLERIADYLDVSVDYLLGRTDTPNTYSISNQDTTINGTQANVINNAEKQDEMTEELVKAFKSMSFPDKMDIMNAVLSKSKKKA